MCNKYNVDNYIKEYNDLNTKQDKMSLKDFIIEKVTEESIEDYKSSDGRELYTKYIEDKKLYDSLSKIEDECYNNYKVAKENCQKQFFVYDKSKHQYEEVLKDYIAKNRLNALEALDSHCSKDYFEKTEYTCSECGKVCNPHFKYKHSYFCSKACLYKSFGIWGDGTDETWHVCKNCGDFVGHHIVTNKSEDMFCSMTCACEYYNIDILRKE